MFQVFFTACFSSSKCYLHESTSKFHLGEKLFYKIIKLFITWNFVLLLQTLRGTQNLQRNTCRSFSANTDSFRWEFPCPNLTCHFWALLCVASISFSSWFTPWQKQPTDCKVLVRLLWFTLDLRCVELCISPWAQNKATEDVTAFELQFEVLFRDINLKRWI